MPIHWEQKKPCWGLPKLALLDKLGTLYPPCCQESMPANFSPLCKYNLHWYALTFNIHKGQWHPVAAREMPMLAQSWPSFLGWIPLLPDLLIFLLGNDLGDLLAWYPVQGLVTATSWSLKLPKPSQQHFEALGADTALLIFFQQHSPQAEKGWRIKF